MSERASNSKEVDIHVEDLQEIISKPPSWLLKRGISLVLMTVILLVALSFFIKYPDIVTTPIKFNTPNAPKPVVAQANGTIIKILQPEGALLQPNTHIAYLESSADHEEVLALLDNLKQFRNADIDISFLKNIFPDKLRLGELQGNFQNFFLAYLEYKAANENGIYQQRRTALISELHYLANQREKLQQVYELQKKALELAEIEYDKFATLESKKVISPSELNQRKALILAKRQTIPQMDNNIISIKKGQLAKKKEIAEIDYQIFAAKKRFLQALNSFISEGEEWRRLYVLTTRVAGSLVYSGFLQENQYVVAGQELFYVDPEKQNYYGEIKLTQNQMSTVRVNQNVLIRVDTYPYQQFGHLKGRIKSISDIPLEDSMFKSKVEIIRTPQDSVINLKPGVSGTVEIITDDKSIFKKIWLNLMKSF